MKIIKLKKLIEPILNINGSKKKNSRSYRINKTAVKKNV